MLNSASMDYGYDNDDMLTDAISSLSMIACAMGEILGPLYSGFVSDMIGIENACNICAALSFGVALGFALGSGAVSHWFRKKNTKSGLLINTRVVPEEIFS